MERQASAEVGALLLIVVETRVAGGGCQAERLHLHGNHQPGEQEIRFINNLSLTEELLVENVQSIYVEPFLQILFLTKSSLLLERKSKYIEGCLI